MILSSSSGQARDIPAILSPLRKAAGKGEKKGAAVEKEKHPSVKAAERNKKGRLATAACPPTRSTKRKREGDYWVGLWERDGKARQGKGRQPQKGWPCYRKFN